MAEAGEDKGELAELKRALNEMVEGGLPVTKSKISAVAECALKQGTNYKKVVYTIERFIRHAEVPYRSAGICVIDSLCTKAHKAKEKDVFTPRFAVRMNDTVASLKGVSRSDKALLNRIFAEWKKRGWFNVSLLSTKEDKGSSSSAKGFSPDVSEDGSGRESEAELRARQEEEARRAALLREQQVELEKRQQEMLAEQEAKRREAQEKFRNLLEKAPLPPGQGAGPALAPPILPPTASQGAPLLDPRKRSAASAGLAELSDPRRPKPSAASAVKVEDAGGSSSSRPSSRSSSRVKPPRPADAGSSAMEVKAAPASSVTAPGAPHMEDVMEVDAAPPVPDSASLEAARGLVKDFLAVFEAGGGSKVATESSKWWPHRLTAEGMKPELREGSPLEDELEEDGLGGTNPPGFVVGVKGLVLVWKKRRLQAEARDGGPSSRPGSRLAGGLVSGSQAGHSVQGWGGGAVGAWGRARS